ncbi:MAG: DNA-processing protein DprA [Thermoleophilia bacterium]
MASPGKRKANPRERAVCVWLGGLASYRSSLFRTLLRECGTYDDILSLSPSHLRAALATPRRRPQRTELNRGAADDPESARAFAAILAASPADYLTAVEHPSPRDTVVAWCEALYPRRLATIADPPFCLFVRAQCDAAERERRLATLNSASLVAVVGTRAPSAYGEEMATLLGRDLRRRGAMVVSGMAMGIDAAAQGAAVSAGGHDGLPTTIAVLGCGADIVYPRVNRDLFAQVARTGLLLSEYAWGVPARAWRFPARNRIMAGLAHAVVVVEGTERSGARLTADFALESGREVLAVPGEAGRRLSSAPHRLLREGAAMCESAVDVLEAINHEATSCPSATEIHPSEAKARANGAGSTAETVMAALDQGAMTVEELTVRCALDARRASAALSELEVDGRVRRCDNGVFRRQHS